MAESEGFEPPEDFSSTVFKTAAFDHSASSPETLQVTCHQLLNRWQQVAAYYKHLKLGVIR